MSFLASFFKSYNEGEMKINARKVTAGSFFIALCCMAAIYYRNARSPYGNWVYYAQKPDGGQISIQMLLYQNEPSALLWKDFISSQIRASQHLRRQELLGLRCIDNKDRLDIYEINKVSRKKHLLAVASISGSNQLEVRFLRPLHTGFSSRVFFKRKKWPDA